MRDLRGPRADPVPAGRRGELAGENSEDSGGLSGGLRRGGIQGWPNLWVIFESQEPSRYRRWVGKGLTETPRAPPLPT